MSNQPDIYLVLTPNSKAGGIGVVGIFLSEEDARQFRDTYFKSCRIYQQQPGAYIPTPSNLAAGILPD